MSVAVRVFAIPTFGVHYALVHAGYRIFLVAWVGGGGAMRPVVSTCDACSPARMLHSVHGWMVHGVVDGVTHTLSMWMHPHLPGIAYRLLDGLESRYSRIPCSVSLTLPMRPP